MASNLMFALTFAAVTGTQPPTFNTAKYFVSNWKDQAKTHLNVTDDDLKKNNRCIKLNNYWCLKNVSGGWNGTLGSDQDRHAAFVDGAYAARAAVRNFRTAYFKHNRKSALQIMSYYAPDSDCIGSGAATNSDGTCVNGHNNSKAYATYVIKGIAGDIDADLQLFDVNGVANEKNMTVFLQNLSKVELAGAKVSAELIKKGICMEVAKCPHPNN